MSGRLPYRRPASPAELAETVMFYRTANAASAAAGAVVQADKALRAETPAAPPARKR